MNRIDEFRQAKNSFILYILAFSTLWFLAVCILFGVYVWCSFHNVSIEATQTQGNYSNQGVAGGTVSIN